MDPTQSKPRDASRLLTRGLSTSLGRSLEIRTALRFDWAQRSLSQPEPARLSLSFWLRLCWEPAPRASYVLPFAAELRSRRHLRERLQFPSGLRGRFQDNPFRG